MALIEPADPRSKLLSFTNLCELHLLTSIQCRHRVPMAGGRKAIDYVKRSLGVDHALPCARGAAWVTAQTPPTRRHLAAVS